LADRAFRLSELQARLGGVIHGQSDPLLTDVASLDHAEAHHLSFVVGRGHLKSALDSRAGGLLVSNAAMAESLGRSCLIVANPHAEFVRAIHLFHADPALQPGIHPGATVDSRASLGADCEIGPGAVIEADARIGARCRIGANTVIGRGAVIGDDCLMYANVTIYHGCRLGARVILHSGCVIGADGFGLAWDNDHWLKVPQIGRVIIEDDVEIGANTTIDRGALDDTLIETGVKIDNQVQIAHNCRIGAHTAIAGCVGIAGSARIGKRCRIGGGASIMGHFEIADDVTVTAGSFSAKDILRPGTYTSIQPLMTHADWLKNAAQIRHLADFRKRLSAMEKRIAELAPKES
jgi:UDP-3-O-[3-hydroxymyristoyl] glucosamine N-acyltransferase